MTSERHGEDDLTGEVLAITDQLLNQSRELLDDLDDRLGRGESGSPHP